MAEHDGVRRMTAGMLVQIGMADTDRDDAHEQFARARRFQLQLFQTGRGLIGATDGSGDLHHFAPATGGALWLGFCLSRMSPFHGT